MADSMSPTASIAPLFLRLALATVFIWAGLGKLVEFMPVKGEAAAVLANMGVLKPTERIIEVPKSGTGGSTDQPKDSPSTSTPPVSPVPAPATTPPTSSAPPTRPVPTEPLPPSEPEPAKDAASTPQAAHQAVVRPGDEGVGRLVMMQLTPATNSKPRAADQSPPPPSRPVSAAVVYEADEFPEDAPVRKVFGLALLLHGAVNPGVNEDGKALMPLWPEAVGRGRWPVYVAWAAALTELVGGLMVLVGLFTRLSALGLAGTMCAAMWLTEIGPALQSGHTRLGFLPEYPTFDPASWQPLLLQFSLLTMAMSLVFLGCGAMGLDRAMFAPAPAAHPRSKPEAS